MSHIRRLNSLYRRIPEIMSTCPHGCIKCCGLIPWSKPEVEIVYQRTGMFPAVNEQGMCIFAQEGVGCAIYDIRPFMCRIFGHGPKPPMRCELNQCSDILTELEANELVAKYVKFVDMSGGTYIPIGGKKFFCELNRNKK